MSIGPITIFDKSTLQALNPDEACWFGHFYRANITPLFFVETLADIEKAVAGGRDPEQVVGNLAYKTPSWALPNVNHTTLCVGNLMGAAVTMRGVPIRPSGRRVSTGDQRGMILQDAPEMEALRRWQRGEFLDVERQFARVWRRALSRLDLAQTRSFLQTPRVRDLAEAKSVAEQWIRRRGRFQTLKNALEILGVPPEMRPEILARWKSLGGPPFSEFAPYAAYVLTVELFFYFALGSGLTPQDANTRVDIAYLYYLPFCMVFVSSDRWHASTAPLFLRNDQVFIKGPDLKKDLARLDAYYSQLPEEVKAQGIMRFAPDPPEEGDFLTSQLWDRFLPKWRENKGGRVARSPETDRRILDRLTYLDLARPSEPGEAFDMRDADFLKIEMNVPVRMGKWRVLPPEVQGTRAR